MLDRAFVKTFRSFSTLFLVVAVVTLPLHLIYSFTFRNVIATTEIHDQIRRFPNYRQVRSVGPRELRDATLASWVLTAVEIALVPLGVRAARRVIEVEDAGGVATVPDAWRTALRRGGGSSRFQRASVSGAAIGVLVAVALGWLLGSVGAVVRDPLGPDFVWLGHGVVGAVARAAAAPFALTALALARAAKADPLPAPKLY